MEGAGGGTKKKPTVMTYKCVCALSRTECVVLKLAKGRVLSVKLCSAGEPLFLWRAELDLAWLAG